MRSVSVYPEHKEKFFELTLKGVEHAKQTAGIDAEPFVVLDENSSRVNVRIYSDFESCAQYEELFLHRMLKNDDFLDVPEAAVEMVHDNPLDELYVRLDVEDYFMNRKGATNLGKDEFVARTEKRPYRVERLFTAAKGRLREAMQVNFEYFRDYKERTGETIGYHCTRFAAGRIGGAVQDEEVRSLIGVEERFREQDAILAARPGLLLRPTVNTIMRRITADMLNAPSSRSDVSDRILHDA
jgi:hypothetical protein